MKPDANVVQQTAVFQVIGLIAETCKDSYKENINEQMTLLSQGVINENVRVKYAALEALACLMDVLSPVVQRKYHS